MSTLRRSLRYRIFGAALLAGLILGPLVAVAILFVSVELQEWQKRHWIGEQLGAVADAPGDHPLVQSEAVPGVFVLGDGPLERLPQALLGLDDGIHEYETGTDAWLIGLRTAPDRRYAVVANVWAIERRERQALPYAIAGALGATLAALVIAVLVARRLSTPLERLASRVSTDDAGSGNLDTSLAAGLPDDEIRTLALALDRYRTRVRDALARERHFSADVSHELRNPLSVIQNAAEILQDDRSLGPASRRALTRIIHAGRRMEDTVTSLLSLARESSSDTGEPPVDLAARVLAVIEQECTAAGPDTPEIRWEPRATPTLAAPPTVIDTLVANLVRNALQHARADCVRVSLEADRLTVQDNGIGMPAEQLRHFRGLPAGSVPADSRAGIGLSLIQRLAAHYGWTVELESVPAAGTRAIWRFIATS